MLEEASWIATIVAAIIAFLGLVWVGKTISNRINTKQNARVSGQNNTVTQSSKVGTDN